MLSRVQLEKLRQYKEQQLAQECDRLVEPYREENRRQLRALDLIRQKVGTDLGVQAGAGLAVGAGMVPRSGGIGRLPWLPAWVVTPLSHER